MGLPCEQGGQIRGNGPQNARSISPGPDGGVADALDEAKAAFRQAWGGGPSTARPARNVLAWISTATDSTNDRLTQGIHSTQEFLAMR